jgi:drug/metabolite transporter (DMT)-like permease
VVPYWLVLSLAAAALAGYFAYLDAEKILGAVDMLATFISILIGASLAVIAVLSSPFSVSEKSAKDSNEAARKTKLVKQDDETRHWSMPTAAFRTFYAALFLALAFKWVTAGETIDFSLMHIKLLACVTAVVGIMAFFCSARLPRMLQRIASQRRSLGS